MKKVRKDDFNKTLGFEKKLRLCMTFLYVQFMCRCSLKVFGDQEYILPTLISREKRIRGRDYYI